MQITAIFTTGETKLTIATTEEAFFEERVPGSLDTKLTRLEVGVTSIPVDRGVYWVTSNSGIRVSTDTIHVVTMRDKKPPIESLAPPGYSADDLGVIALKSHSLG